MFTKSLTFFSYFLFSLFKSSTIENAINVYENEQTINSTGLDNNKKSFL